MTFSYGQPQREDKRRADLIDPWQGTLVVVLAETATRPYHLSRCFRNTDVIRQSDDRIALWIRLAVEKKDLLTAIRLMVVRVWIANDRFTELTTRFSDNAPWPVTVPNIWRWEQYVEAGLRKMGETGV